MNKNLRNVLIILLTAALVVLIPGGGTGAGVATQVVSLAFLAAIGWAAHVLYREHRMTLYGFGDTRRAALYVAAGVAVLTLSATSRLWTSPGGKLAWFVLLGGVAYTVFAVVRAARRY